MISTDAKFWDDIAEKYAAQPVANVGAFERKKAVNREHLRPDSTVLELGCGTGSLALEMAPFAAHIHALDHSAQMIRIAERKKLDQGVTNVSFRQATASDLGAYPRASFDCVWAYSVLHLVAERSRTLESVFQLLKPGGSFISSNVCLGDSLVPYGPITRVLGWFGKAPRVYIYKRETILRELAEAGFVDITEREVGAEARVMFLVAKRPGAR